MLKVALNTINSELQFNCSALKLISSMFIYETNMTEMDIGLKLDKTVVNSDISKVHCAYTPKNS